MFDKTGVPEAAAPPGLSFKEGLYIVDVLLVRLSDMHFDVPNK